MYVAVKGGEHAIDSAHRLLEETRRGNPSVAEIEVSQIREQLGLAVARVMTEGSLYDEELAALAIKQAQGDLVEAIFLLRAYRTTLPRLAVSEPIDTGAMHVSRRISATFKDLPGGQILGPTYDYTHRLLDFSLLQSEGGGAAAAGTEPGSHEPGAGSGRATVVPAADTATATVPPHQGARSSDATMPRVTALLDREGLVEAEHPPATEGPAYDLTREPTRFPAERDQRLQNLVRGDEGFLLALGYSTQRGFGGTHPFAGEIRLGSVEVEIVPVELGFPICLGEITVTECEMINQFKGSAPGGASGDADPTPGDHAPSRGHDPRESGVGEGQTSGGAVEAPGEAACGATGGVPPQFTRGYGLGFGHCERKVMAMALVDRALRAAELGEDARHPAQDQEFVLAHADNVEASGFVSHLKLPHYVDFQSELQLVRALRAEFEAGAVPEAAE